jgi:dihydroceramidase
MGLDTNFTVYRNTLDPFWGPVTANVDWCEKNYSYTPYIAELFNTLSSLPMIWMGIVGLIETQRMGLGRNYGLSFFCLAIVGLGSVLFHATLLYSCQLADELPMVFGTLAGMYQMMDIVVSLYREGKLFVPNWVTVSALTSMGVITTVLMASWTHTPLPMFVSYGAMTAFIFCSSAKLYMDKSDFTSKKVFEVSSLSYLLGAMCWLVEKHFCGIMLTQYLHAFWHLFAGFGVYTFLTWGAYLKATSLKHRPRLSFRALLPVVTSGADKAE